MRVQFHLVQNRIEEYSFYKKLEIVAKRRRTSIDLLCKNLLLDNQDILDGELDFWLDKTDDDIKKEVLRELSRCGVNIKVRVKTA